MKKFPTRVSRSQFDLAHLTNLGLKLLLPILCFSFVLSELSIIAFGLILIAKWRVLAVKSRYWALNLRSNMVDVIFGLSVVAFMNYTASNEQYLFATVWLAIFMFWTIYVRNLASYWGILTQALLALSFGVSAIVYSGSGLELWQLVIGTWFVAYFSARHILSINEDSVSPLLASVWAVFAAQMAWTLGHWQIWFSIIHQLVFVLTVIGLALALLYTHDKEYGLDSKFIRLVSASTSIILIAVLVLSDWRDKAL